MKPLTLQNLLDRGLDMRTLERWIELGYLRPVKRGRGTPREWPPAELAAADLMRRLTEAGISHGVASIAARAHQTGRPIIRLATGVVLAIDTDLLAEAQ